MFKNLDFTPGTIVYNDFDINPNIPFEKQRYSFKEDMLQVSYDKDKYLIDIGFHPEHDQKGKFKILIIKDYDWENPIYCKRTKNLARLNKLFKECVGIIRRLL